MPCRIATRSDSVVDQLGRGERLRRVFGDPRAGLGDVEEAVALLDAVLDRRQLADADQATEAARARRPQESDEGRRGERDDADAHQADRGPVEELPARFADHLGIGWRPRHDLRVVIDGGDGRAGLRRRYLRPRRRTPSRRSRPAPRRCRAAWRSRLTVSPDRAPAPRTSLRRARVKNATAARTTTTATTMAMTAAVLMTGLLSAALQLEEQAVVPGQDEVEAGPSEERADDDEHRPEHEVHGHQRGDELAILRLVRRIAIEIRGEDQRDDPDARAS